MSDRGVPLFLGDSQYQCQSSFAGNGLLISPDGLVDDGLLRAADCAGPAFSPTAVEYEKVVPFKLRMLETAWSRFSAGARPDLRPAYEQFCEVHGRWLDDYALFRPLWFTAQTSPRVCSRPPGVSHAQPE